MVHHFVPVIKKEKKRLASALTAVLLLISLASCAKESEDLTAWAEANSLSSGKYHIEIVADNETVLFAYASDVTETGNATYWDGTATVGAYAMAFCQECRSFRSEDAQAKQWRSTWIQTDISAPSQQLRAWIQQIRPRDCITVTAARSDIPFETDPSLSVTVAKLTSAQLQWAALCDARIDTFFGGQDFLTSVQEGEVTLYFDAETDAILGASFTAGNGQTNISGTIIVSAFDGQYPFDLPNIANINTDADSEALLNEQWVSYKP